MIRTVVLWALVLTAGALALQWLQYQYLVHTLAPQVYVAVVGVAFDIFLSIAHEVQWRGRHPTLLRPIDQGIAFAVRYE